MNNDYIDLKSPKQAGWHWWKPTAENPATGIIVTDDDIKSKKFRNFGGEWHQFPTFNEVMEYRQAYYDLYQRAKVNEGRIKVAEFTLIEMAKMLNYATTKTFTPKVEIKELLAKIQKSPTSELPLQ